MQSSLVLLRNLVMLSVAKHLGAHRERPFAEFTLSAANGLRVTSRPWRLPCLGPPIFFLKTIVNIYTIWHHGIILLPEESKVLLNEAKNCL